MLSRCRCLHTSYLTQAFLYGKGVKELRSMLPNSWNLESLKARHWALLKQEDIHLLFINSFVMPLSCGTLQTVHPHLVIAFFFFFDWWIFDNIFVFIVCLCQFVIRRGKDTGQILKKYPSGTQQLFHNNQSRLCCRWSTSTRGPLRQR